MQMRTGEIERAIAVREFDEVQSYVGQTAHMPPEVGGKTATCRPL
jgi:hypothetical protein